MAVPVDDLVRVDEFTLQCVCGRAGLAESTFGVVSLRRAGGDSEHVTEERRVGPGAQQPQPRRLSVLAIGVGNELGPTARSYSSLRSSSSSWA